MISKGISIVRPLLLLLSALLLVSCDTIGPSSIRSGRAAYNEAIGATSNQQILSLIVKSRYGESAGLLSVANVSANFKVTGQVGGQVGIGPDESFAGNLIPLSAGAAYEESPTISYIPVQGEDYLHEIFGPLPLEITMLMIQASQNPGWTMTMLLKSINGIRNPAFLSSIEPKVDTRFARISEILTALHRAERLSWLAKADGSLVLVISGNDSPYREQIRKLYKLIDLSYPAESIRVHEIPVLPGVGRTAEQKVFVETRSLGELIKIASAAMDVPHEQIASGLAADTSLLGPVGSLIRIPGTQEAPDNALVAVKHHGVWYSIDLTDQKSKHYFSQLEELLSARIADAAHSQGGSPVLTLPVAR